MSLVKYILALGIVVTMLSGCSFGKIWPNQSNQLKSSGEKELFFAADSGKQKKNDLNKEVVAASPTAKNTLVVKRVSTPKITSFRYTELTIQAQECLQKYYVGYEYALCLYNSGDISSAESYLSSFSDNNSDNKLASQLLKKITTPLEYIVEEANFKLNKWLSIKSDVPLFNMKPPENIKYNPQALSLIKREFETSKAFDKRVISVQKETEVKDYLVEQRHKEKMVIYNQALDSYNASLSDEKKQRQSRSEDVYLDFVNTSIINVLGAPYFSNPIYNADTQKMFVYLSSKKSNFNKLVAIDLPLEEAKLFKVNITQTFPVLEFNTSRKALSIAKISADFLNKVYPAQLLKNDNSLPVLGTVQKNITSKFSK
ncbi:hypothetical protein CVFO_0980 [Isorropodon fossajaponicum endosymbiont JTNG4]|uniref:hypothetical protein n=1 Tax=Isorropodon fossajaponicum symbiont TaxID=883811 RepID=UPI0019165019|nr:hypothetical protein [Isorropodon fossajaponicum symbiont]BBB24131.1 hypothetical protein CVFO_0980 [Isorropodon fossajaponicum endosymbiont JTNG4]